MTYKLDFTVPAWKEWEKLGATVQLQFRKKLVERLETPRVPAHAMRKMKDCYKIKLRQSGYRLIYKVQDRKITVLVFAIGKREADEAYLEAARRLDDLD